MKEDTKESNYSENSTERFNKLHRKLVYDGDVADANMISHEDSEKRTKRWFRERNKMEEIQ